MKQVVEDPPLLVVNGFGNKALWGKDIALLRKAEPVAVVVSLTIQRTYPFGHTAAYAVGVSEKELEETGRRIRL